MLPAAKVSEEVSRIRGIPPGKASISPNRHPEIDCNTDLLRMLAHIRNLTGRPTGFKAVLGSGRWLDELFTDVHRLGEVFAPDFITVDSADGGTGAAPMALMDDVGLPLRESLPLLVDKRAEYDLRQRVRVIASGKLVNPTQVDWALCMGADFITTARGFMFALGCIQAMQCNRNTCPTGITTHNPGLQRGLDPEAKPIRVASYARNLQHEVGLIAHSCGVRSPRDLRRHHARVVQGDGRSLPLGERRLGFAGGIRGAVPLALALALPVKLEAWWTVQALVFGVVAFQLRVQAPLVQRLSPKLGQAPTA